jgi:hypothetical protein
MNPIRFESVQFGSLVVNGSRHEHDFIITVAGEIVPRPKQLSKKYGGWHTVLGPEEIESALIGAPEILLVALGHLKQLPILDSTRVLLTQRGVQIETASTPNALMRYDQLNASGKRVAAIFHLTC